MACRMHETGGRDARATQHAAHIRCYLLQLGTTTFMGYLRERRKCRIQTGGTVTRIMHTITQGLITHTSQTWRRALRAEHARQGVYALPQLLVHGRQPLAKVLPPCGLAGFRLGLGGGRPGARGLARGLGFGRFIGESQGIKLGPELELHSPSQPARDANHRENLCG